MLGFLTAVAAGFVGSNLALVIWIHFDLEGHWEQRRLKRAAEFDARELARDHKAIADHQKLLAEERRRRNP